MVIGWGRSGLDTFNTLSPDFLPTLRRFHHIEGPPLPLATALPHRLHTSSLWPKKIREASVFSRARRPNWPLHLIGSRRGGRRLAAAELLDVLRDVLPSHAGRGLRFLQMDAQ